MKLINMKSIEEHFPLKSRIWDSESIPFDHYACYLYLSNRECLKKEFESTKQAFGKDLLFYIVEHDLK